METQTAKLLADIKAALERAIEMRSRQGQENWTYHDLIARIEEEEARMANQGE